jgi:hypothetical protein
MPLNTCQSIININMLHIYSTNFSGESSSFILAMWMYMLEASFLSSLCENVLSIDIYILYASDRNHKAFHSNMTGAPRC